MTAECGAALDDGSPAGLALGLELSLFMLPASLIPRAFGDGPVRFDHNVADTLSVRDLSFALSVAIAPEIGITFAYASVSLFFSFGSSVF